jgi:peptidoglycan/LPS O-acetylase OafA/YrhL
MDYFFRINSLFPKPMGGYFGRFAFIGSLGVDIFFVISGFLISGLLIGDMDSKVRIKRFYLRRFFKIVPQYLLCVIAGIILVLMMGWARGSLLFSIASYLFFFQNYVQPMTPIAHLWSIAVEEHFYLIYPLILQLVCMVGRSLEHRKRALFCIFLLGMVSVFFVRRYTFVAFPYNSLLLFQMSHLRFDALLFGCMIKLIEPVLTGQFISRLKFFPAACFLFSILLFYKLFLSFDPCRSTTYVFAYIASGFLIISAISGFRPLLALTENNVMREIGKCSYATYLWHYPLLVIFSIFFKNPVNPFILMAVPVVILMTGILSTKTIERYFLSLRDKVVP